MSADAKSMGTLASIERVLSADRCSVSVALEAAYKLGRIDGMLEALGPPDSRCIICGAKMRNGVPIETTAHRNCRAP